MRLDAEDDGTRTRVFVSLRGLRLFFRAGDGSGRLVRTGVRRGGPKYLGSVSMVFPSQGTRYSRTAFVN